MLSWRGVAVVWAAAAALAVAFGPRATEPAALVGADLPPRVPDLPARDAEAQIAALKAAALWGAAAAPTGPGGGAAAGASAEAALTPPDWRIVAVVSGQSDRFVVVKTADQPETHELRVGQSLPDGSQIRRIEPTALYLLVHGQKRILRIDEQ
jgi:hypothetical protein